MCMATCGDGAVYNVTALSCQIVVNGSNSTNGSANASNTTGNISLNTSAVGLSFVPMPYTIVAGVGCGFVLALSWALGVSIYGALFGAMGTLLQFSMATCAVVAATSVVTNARLLQTVEAAVSIGSTLLGRIFIVLTVCIGICIILNVAIGVLYFCKVRTKVYKTVGVLSMLLGCKLIGCLLCSNFYGINMRARNKKYLAPEPSSELIG